MVVAGLGAVALAGFAWMARRASRDKLLAIMGLIFLLAFILVRASSFHRIDRFLGLRLGGLKWNWILELGGILCVGLAALWSRRAARTGITPRAAAGPDRPRSWVREISEALGIAIRDSEVLSG